MRINEIITEAPEYSETSDSVRSIMGNQNSLARGYDAEVYKHPTDPNKVIKVLIGGPDRPARRARKGFTRFYAFVKANPDNEHLPKFSKPKILIKNDKETVFKVDMERLNSVDWDDPINRIYLYATESYSRVEVIKKMIANLTRTHPEVLKEKNIDPESLMDAVLWLRHTVGQIRNSIGMGRLTMDLHNENIMQRDDGTLVITDPYVSFGK